MPRAARRAGHPSRRGADGCARPARGPALDPRGWPAQASL